MGLSSREHQEIQQQAKANRNAAARARRQAPVHYVRVLLADGRIALAAQSRSALGAAYELTQTAPGRWSCTCQGYQWRGRCAHSAAAEEWRSGEAAA
jgi:hypothetical protein